MLTYVIKYKGKKHDTSEGEGDGRKKSHIIKTNFLYKIEFIKRWVTFYFFLSFVFSL